MGLAAASARRGRSHPCPHPNDCRDPAPARVQLAIIGDGPHRSRLQSVLPTAIFTGMLEGDALGRAVASLDIFVHAGTHETFCQGIQEAMAAGVPVIAPAAGGPRDLVVHGETGLLFAPGRPRLLIEAVRSLVGEPGLRRTMGAAGCRRVADNSWEANGDELIAHYGSVLATRAQPPAASA